MIAARSDFLERKKLMAIAQAGLAIALAFAGWSTSAWGLAVALASAGTASGIACGAAQALLVEGHANAERAMVRWSLFASIGDVLTPLVVGALLASGHSYRLAMLLVAGVVAIQAVASFTNARAVVVAPPEDDEPAPEPILQAISRAARLPRLWLWLFASTSCTLLDELVIALAALRFVRTNSWSEGRAAFAITAFSVGAVAGSLVADRVVARFGARCVLAVSAIAALVGLAVLVGSVNALGGVAALFVLGVVVAPHHPLALARAYGELPRNPGAVQALLQPFAAIDVVAPILLGVVADRAGLTTAIACLALQPMAIVLAAALTKDGPAGSSDAERS